MKPLPIVWQRLVSQQGTTCPRCSDTGEAVQQAVQQLQQALGPLGITPQLEVKALDDAAFLQDTLQSNQILIAGHTLEHWLGATTGSSRCCKECGDNECRTLEVGGQVHEAIPQELMVRAGLIAASQMLGAAPSCAPAASASTTSCCSNNRCS